MNPNYYNPYNVNTNVGSGWSSNYNCPNNNNNQYPIQNYGNGSAPPAIGFVVPGYTQPANYNPNQMGYNANYGYNQMNNMPGQVTNQESPIASAPQLTHNTNYANAPNSGFYQMNNNQPNAGNSQTTRLSPAPSRPSNPPRLPSTANQSAISQPSQPQTQTNLPSKPIEQKSDYQKGLDRLADLMNDDVDLNSGDMEKMRKSYDLNR